MAHRAPQVEQRLAGLVVDQSCASTRGARSTVDGGWPSPPASASDLLQPGRKRGATDARFAARLLAMTGGPGSHSRACAVQARAASDASPRPCTAPARRVEVEHLFTVLVTLAPKPPDPDAVAGVRLLDDAVVEAGASQRSSR